MREMHTALVHLGFSEKEASVYIAALELGISSVMDIARRAGTNRATTYSVLESLERKMLVVQSNENGERRYLAESPARIHELLDIQAQEIEYRRVLAQEKMPTLMRFHNAFGAKPSIRYFEGIEGLRRLQREYEAFEDDIIQIVGYDFFQLLQSKDLVGEHRDKLKERSRRVRSIFVTDQRLRFPAGLDIEYVTISPSVVSIQGEMTVCGNRLVLFSYADGVAAVEIISATIAQTARETLELAWKEAQQWKNEE